MLDIGVCAWAKRSMWRCLMIDPSRRFIFFLRESCELPTTRRPYHLRNRAFFALDLLLLPASTLASFVARFEGFSWGDDIEMVLWAYLALSLPLKLISLFALGMYRRLWRYASVSDLEAMIYAVATCAAVSVGVGIIFLPGAGILPVHVPYSILLLDICLTSGVLILPRLLVRLLSRRDRRLHGIVSRRVIVVGAGTAGGMIVRELVENPQLGMLPVALLDDDTRKKGLRLHNVPVLGSLASLEVIASRVGASEVVIAMPSASGRTIGQVVRQASEAGLETRTVPGLYELLSGERSVNSLRKIEIDDLLRREPIQTDLQQVSSLVKNRVVLVTGAGGSIGSELCRQLARLQPEAIIALGRGENSIFELTQEFARVHPDTCLIPVIADVRDYNRMRRVFLEHRPFSVFHAAAHKHVPLMEENVSEAVLNNVLGTRHVVTLAAEHGVEHFVLISTDKAVRPTSVMGSTKRIAECIVHDVAARYRKGFVAVRFGNVLGSRGSVVPTFMRQIAEGGPVTITHPDMTRFFMTIPEAVQLVLQAAAFAQNGEVFVLDMGEPVRVLDLARDMIRLSGVEEHRDIEVTFTGLRPGEKLFEELFLSNDDVSPTAHPKILRARDATFPSGTHDEIDTLIATATASAPARELRRIIARLVPEYSGTVDTIECEPLSDDVGEVLANLGDRVPVTSSEDVATRA
jgi:FlaA1/EpsC-like NDP-sugar epimerase